MAVIYNGTNIDKIVYNGTEIFGGGGIKVLWSAIQGIGNISDWSIPSGLTVTKNSANELVINKPASSTSSYRMQYTKSITNDSGGTSIYGFAIMGKAKKTSSWWVTLKVSIKNDTFFSQNFDASSDTKFVDINNTTSQGGNIYFDFSTQYGYTSNNSGEFRISEIYFYTK